jgi:hypothetical protein
MNGSSPPPCRDRGLIPPNRHDVGWWRADSPEDVMRGFCPERPSGWQRRIEATR